MSLPQPGKPDQQQALGFLDAKRARLRSEGERCQAQQPADGLVATDVLDGNRRSERQRAVLRIRSRFSSSTRRAVLLPKPRSRTAALARTFSISVTVRPSSA